MPMVAMVVLDLQVKEVAVAVEVAARATRRVLVDVGEMELEIRLQMGEDGGGGDRVQIDRLPPMAPNTQVTTQCWRKES